VWHDDRHGTTGVHVSFGTSKDSSGVRTVLKDMEDGDGFTRIIQVRHIIIHKKVDLHTESSNLSYARHDLIGIHVNAFPCDASLVRC
jgi:hypothetical protein